MGLYRYMKRKKILEKGLGTDILLPKALTVSSTADLHPSSLDKSLGKAINFPLALAN